MVSDNLFGIVFLSVCVQLPKVINQGTHAGREVQYTIH